MNYFKYRKRLDYLTGSMLIWIRYIFDYAKEPIIFTVLGFFMGVSVRSLFADSEVKQLQREYKIYHDLVDSCFLNSRVILPSSYDFGHDKACYHEMINEENTR